MRNQQKQIGPFLKLLNHSLTLDFSKAFVQWWEKSLLKHSDQRKRRNRSTQLCLSEIITIMIAYHKSGYRCFKNYYTYVLTYHLKEFPKLVSYDRFVSLMKRTMPIVLMLFAVLRGEATDILFADSTPYEVCRTARRYGHKVFQGLAALSKNSLGWFYGLKLHFIFNDKGEIVRLSITPANVDDRKGLKRLIGGLMGKLFADRGYLGQDFFEELWNQGLQVITRIRKNMKNKLMPLWDRFYLDKRMTVEPLSIQDIVMSSMPSAIFSVLLSLINSGHSNQLSERRCNGYNHKTLAIVRVIKLKSQIRCCTSNLNAPMLKTHKSL